MKRTLISIVVIALAYLMINSVNAATTYTTTTVSTHNVSTDCWMIFENKVYDITNYIKSHDKYMDIRSWCGKDMTQDFITKAGTGVDHKDSTYTLLEAYYIGDLVPPTAVTTILPQTTTVPSTPEESEDDEYSVEIEGQVMKTLTIKQIADLWIIDPDLLLSEIIKEFSLTGLYTTSTVLDDMRAEYKFSPAQIKDIAEAIKNGEIDPTATDNTPIIRTSTNPYNFALPFLGVILTYWPLYFVVKKIQPKYPRALQKFNFAWNTLLVIGLIPSALFGFYLIFRYSIPELNNVDFDFTWWHVEGSVVFGTIAISHLIQRLNQYLIPLKRLPKK